MIYKDINHASPKSDVSPSKTFQFRTSTSTLRCVDVPNASCSTQDTHPLRTTTKASSPSTAATSRLPKPAHETISRWLNALPKATYLHHLSPRPSSPLLRHLQLHYSLNTQHPTALPRHPPLHPLRSNLQTIFLLHELDLHSPSWHRAFFRPLRTPLD